MSARDSGSDTWPPVAALPGDNLELGNAPEEDDVDHHGEPPSWVPGTTAVGTGAGPPDADEADEGQFDRGPMYVAGPDDNDAPGFTDHPGTGQGFGEPGLPEAQPGMPDFQPGQDGAGFGDAPPPDFGEGVPEAPDFTAPPLPFGEGHPGDQAAPALPGDGGGYGDGMGYPAGPGFAPEGQQSFGGPGEPVHQDFTGQQGNEYDGPYTGQFRGDYVTGEPGGFGAAGEDAPLRTAPGMGDPYGGPGYQTDGNGSQPQGQGFTSPYPPPVAPRPPSRTSARISGVTASLRSRRPRKGKGKKRSQPGRQAQLTVSRVEPWSVMKFSFVISLVAFIVLFVAVAVLYGVLAGLGVFSALQQTISNITSSQGSGGFNLMTYISASRVLGYTGLLGAVNVVLITALSTVGAVLYNITSDLAGGIEITLKESD